MFSLKSIFSSSPKKGVFYNIVGLENEKTLALQAFHAIKPVHLLLAGPPSTGKSAILRALKDSMNPKDYVYIIGSMVSKAGITKQLFDKRPKYVFIDEFEYIKPADQALLLSLMGEDGLVSETYMTRSRSQVFETRVIATINNTKKVTKPLLTRFLVINFKSYTREQFINICCSIMPKEEGIPSNIAARVANAMFKDGVTIREAIKVGRLCRSEADVESTIQRVLGVA